MREKFANFIIDNSGISKNCSKTKKQELKYGLECFYTTITKLIVVIAISLIFGFFKYLVVLIIIFSPLRVIGFGFHAKNSFQCWLISLTMYSLFPVLIKLFFVPHLFIFVGAIIFAIIIIIFSPAATKRRPLLNKRKNKKRKIMITIISLLYLTIIFLCKNHELSEIVFLALLFQSFLVNPITFKLLD